MADNGSNNEMALIVALAAGCSVRDAAKRAGVSERTVYRRLHNGAFRHEVSLVRGSMMSQALGKLADAATGAVDTLRALLAAESESVRLSAARSILEIGTRLREADELEGRIEEIELQVNGGTNVWGQSPPAA